MSDANLPPLDRDAVNAMLTELEHQRAYALTRCTTLASTNAQLGKLAQSLDAVVTEQRAVIAAQSDEMQRLRDELATYRPAPVAEPDVPAEADAPPRPVTH